MQKNLPPIYEDLYRENLLEQCLGGYMQNANESFNVTIWRLSPNHFHSELKLIEISAYLSVRILYESYCLVLQIMNMLNLTIGTYAEVFAENTNEQWIERQTGC